MRGWGCPPSLSPYAFGTCLYPRGRMNSQPLLYTDMKITFKNAYRAKTGNATFVYTIQGEAKDLANYKKVLGDKHRHEDDDVKKPSLFFSTTRYNDGTNLCLRRDGKAYYAETELLEKVVENKVHMLKAFGHVTGKTPAQMFQAMFIGDE